MLKLSSSIGRLAVWLVLSFAGVLLILATLDNLPGKLRRAHDEAMHLRTTAMRLEQASQRFEIDAMAEATTADALVARLRTSSAAELENAHRELEVKRAASAKAVLGKGGIAAAAIRGDADAMIGSYRAQWVELPLLDRAIFLAKTRVGNIQERLSYRNDVATLNRRISSYRTDALRYNQLVARRDRLRQEAEAQILNPVCVRLTLPGICSKVHAWRDLAKQLPAQKTKLDIRLRVLQTERAGLRAVHLTSEAVADSKVIARHASNQFRNEVTMAADRSEALAVNTAVKWTHKYGWHATWIVLGALVTPLVHKFIAFVFVAPFASRARSIRLPQGAARIRTSGSHTSVDVFLDRDNELFVRNGVQSASVDITGRSIVFLSWWMPLTCLAAGLVGLQRLRTKRADRVTVTAVDDEHYEVALIEVPAGGAVMLQPRALVGVSKRRSDVLTIRRVWKLGHLISWITFQFRYVVFDGPCTLIVQGHRGVRAEQANGARMINKRLTIGFDTGLSYGAARSTAFLPYLRGQQSLFNDSFAGTGTYIYEQRTAGSSKGMLWGRGLKGLSDAALGALGV